MTAPVDLVIVGAGAAGLAAAIFAGEAARGRGLRILLVDGARKPGAKILVSGGGRCNVTNETITPDDYWGGPRPIIRNVLRAFDRDRTLAWMKELGVPLKLEPTGKYFPVSDSARTVLDALFRRANDVGVELLTDARLTGLAPAADGITLSLKDRDPITARAVILATGGLSLPKSGSDGVGLKLLADLGHTIVPTTPALVPLLLGASAGDMNFAELSGLTIDARMALLDPAGKRLYERTDSLLFTHFGISGPAAMNLSRHYLHPGSGKGRVTMGHPRFRDASEADVWLREQAASNPKRYVANALTALHPERLARMLAGEAGTLGHLTRDARLILARRLTALELPVTGDRGYTFAETTAGGVDLREIDHGTMQSRRVPLLYLCGELLDVDGRIGGFNFQWAWASGHVAGRGAVRALAGSS
jgi:predicted Rossmann fold flavoprotein